MQQLDDYRNFCGTVIFRIVGGATLLLFLFWNPLVLRPRLWNTSVVARSIALDTALVVVGIGFICLRRWAALLSFALIGYVASGLVSTRGGLVGLSLLLLIPLVLTVMFWRTLVWGNRLRDPLLVLGSVVVSATIHYTAFVARL